jgi:AraC family transcriptional regulator of adaptative response / DNA-3-methyladenine glycosylase II
VQLDDEQRYSAVVSKDRRFDGWFVLAVRTTGIYCRPSCPAIVPKRRNCEFLPSAAAAQQHGYRACKRCLPDASPGSPEWNLRGDAVARAVRMIADGVVDRDGVRGLADRLGYSERQVQRLMVAELGAGPLALARAQRAQTARVLIETTALPITEVAFAAGFASVRQFNDTIREVYATTPSEMRARRRPAASGGASALRVRLAVRSPFETSSLFGFLAVRAVPGIEQGDASMYRRALSLPRGAGVVTLRPMPEWIECELVLDDIADLQAAVQRCRRLLDLDADPAAIDAHLSSDPVLAPLVAKRPGLRSPGHPDGPELVVRAVLGQQVSVAGARTTAARLVASHGAPLQHPVGEVTHRFPTAERLADIAAGDLAMPRSRATALIEVNRRIATGELLVDAGADRGEVVEALQRVRGIGPWTAGYVAMRALGDPDVFLPTDLGVRHALVAAAVPADARSAAARAEAWGPFRSYALHHLWASL